MIVLIATAGGAPLFDDTAIKGMANGSWCPQKILLDYLWATRFIDETITEKISMVDKLSGNTFPAQGLSYCDGFYRWNDLLPSYILSYDIEPPESFVKYIVSQYDFKDHDVTFDWEAWDPAGTGLKKIIPVVHPAR